MYFKYGASLFVKDTKRWLFGTINGQEMIDECEADRFSDFARRKMENGCDLYIHYSNVFYEIELEEMFGKKISQY